MKLSKDTYEYLTNFADDRTIINMLSVNKKFQDEEFFERIIRRKYPSLVKFKENDTWKNLFIKSVTYISRLKEFENFEYLYSSSGSPKEYYEILTKRNSDEQVKRAIYKNYKDLIEYLVYRYDLAYIYENLVKSYKENKISRETYQDISNFLEKKYNSAYMLDYDF